MLALTLFLLASQLLLKFADAPRFWLQQRLAPVSAENHAIFREALGDSYIVAPYIYYYYYSSPYYYTPFDAVYMWMNMTESDNYRACAKRSELCGPGVSFIPGLPGSAKQIFQHYSKDVSGSDAPPAKHYCIQGIRAISHEDLQAESQTSTSSRRFVSIFTPNGMYILHNIPEAQIERWRGPCE